MKVAVLVVGGCQVMPVGVYRSPYEKGASITLVLSKESHVRKAITTLWVMSCCSTRIVGSWTPLPFVLWVPCLYYIHSAGCEPC